MKAVALKPGDGKVGQGATGPGSQYAPGRGGSARHSHGLVLGEHHEHMPAGLPAGPTAAQALRWNDTIHHVRYHVHAPVLSLALTLVLSRCSVQHCAKGKTIARSQFFSAYSVDDGKKSLLRTPRPRQFWCGLP